jgi:putative hydrolase of the HAD superfamily
MAIRTILFDADGVLQRATPVRRSLWAELLGGADESVDAFLEDVFGVERTCYNGEGDFAPMLGALMGRWSCTGDLTAALRAWTAIEVDHRILEIIATLRGSGCRCYLASNQEPYRASYMSRTLAYRTVFDGEFYSCTVGYAKPDPAYFRAILNAIGVAGDEVLFIDDLLPNVEAARSVGLRASLFEPGQPERWQDHMRQLLASHGLLQAAPRS